MPAIPVALIACTLAQTRVATIEELGRVKQDIERGKTEIAGIEEEARTTGIPPGWLR